LQAGQVFCSGICQVSEIAEGYFTINSPTGITTFRLFNSVANPIAFAKGIFEESRLEEISLFFPGDDKIVSKRSEQNSQSFNQT